MIKANVHSIESFGSVDGPGVRFIVFLQGCRMRCQYCQNVDTWNQDVVETYTSDELLAKALRFEKYWGKNGGITVSGGEPLLQIDFLIDFFKKAKAKGVHTVIDTAGNPFTREEPFFSKFEELMKYTDMLLLDIKEINPERHKVITGWDNSNILDLARYLSDIHKPIWIRHVLVPERSDYDEDLIELRKFIDTLTNVERVEVLPYHTLGAFKWKELGIPYKLEGIDPPDAQRVQNAKNILGAVGAE